MKVNKQFPNQEEQFVPFDLVLSIESKEEAQALYAIFNNRNNSELFGDYNSDMITGILGYKYYVAGPNKAIANGITHKQYYYGLKD